MNSQVKVEETEVRRLSILTLGTRAPATLKPTISLSITQCLPIQPNITHSLDVKGTLQQWVSVIVKLFVSNLTIPMWEHLGLSVRLQAYGAYLIQYF